METHKYFPSISKGKVAIHLVLSESWEKKYIRFINQLEEMKARRPTDNESTANVEEWEEI